MRHRIWPAAITLLFFLSGLAFIRAAGMHYDASYELASFYTCCFPAFKATLAGHSVPVMILPYLGALKTWLYQPILQYLDVTPFVLRLPMFLVGTFSVWLFFEVLDHVSGRRAAIAGALLLATDATFVVATTYDFGPIVLLHFFMLAGIWLLLRFDATRSSTYLALAFFLFGLALWHKALFMWMLDGLTVAALLVFPKRILALLSPARVALAVASLCLGAFPLICYNVVTRGATFRTMNVVSAKVALPQKLREFKITMNGSVMFGWLTDESDPATAMRPTHFAGKVSVRLGRMVGGMRSNWMFYGFLASCCLVPWLWFTPARAPALFAVAYLAVTWGQMLLIPNAGGSLHHVILLWPFPHFLMGIAGAQLSHSFGKLSTRVVGAVLVAMVACNGLLVNQYRADLLTNGTTVIWTDATYPLLQYLKSLNRDRIITVDWGYATTLCLLSGGQISQGDISYILMGPSDAELAWVQSLMADPQNVFVDYAVGGEQLSGARQVAHIATQAGYSTQVLNVIADRNHRPRFEVVRYIATRR